jgi:DNA-binding MarR family transcriptional regulator
MEQRSGAGSAGDRQVMDKMIEASFQITGMLTRIAAGNDLSLTQLRVLAILRDRQPRMAALAEYLGLDRSTISGLVDRAVARGLVERVGIPEDGRVVHIALTAQGQELADRLGSEMSDAVATLTGRLGGAERADLLFLLKGMLDRADLE